MINHARTLLLNRAAAGRPAVGVFGEEYIPPGYTPVRTSADADALQLLLFGTQPDALYENAMLRQYMGALHSVGPAREYILGLDSRVTYFPVRRELPKSTAETTAGLRVAGSPSADMARGMMLREIEVTRGSGSMVVKEHGSVRETVVGNTATYAGLSFSSARDGTWSVSCVSVYTVTIPDILSQLMENQALFARLVGNTFDAFQKLWKEGQTPVIRLSGLLCMLATERNGALNGR